MLSSYADRIYVLFDPDAAGERAIERAAATAADLKLDLRVLRLPEDPADWLLEHSPGEFAERLNDSVPALEYGIRRIVDRARGAGATERSRAVPEVRSMIQEIRDPVLYREAVRIAAEALGVEPMIFEAPRSDSSASGAYRSIREESGHFLREAERLQEVERTHEAEREILALCIVRPDLSVELFQEGIRVPQLQENVRLEESDFVDEAHAKIFALLEEHVGQDIGSVASDPRARPFLDRLGELSQEGERRPSSEGAMQAAWLRLRIVSRKRLMRETSDYDVKDSLRAEVEALRQEVTFVESS